MKSRNSSAMSRSITGTTALIVALLLFHTPDAPSAQEVNGWLSWRGPNQNGSSVEAGFPSTWEPEGENHLWTFEMPGRGTPVVANGRVYVMGYRGTGPDLLEYLTCLDLKTGEVIWEHGFADFISDIIYNRYSIGSPVIDPATGNVYAMTSPGLLLGFTADGDKLWEVSMMEDYGRLSFPNGRTGSPIIDDDLVIIHAITSHWGGDGPARDRFYAFNKNNGKLVWRSTPGVGPKDSSFSTPVLEWLGDQRVLYAGTGCGNIVAVNARNGKALWRFQLSSGGINGSPVVHGDKVIAISGKENIDDSTIGRMVALDKKVFLETKGNEQAVLNYDHELWRNPLGIFTSSPTLVGDRVYQTVATGDLHAVDVETGESVWSLKLSNSQLHASPLYADGKLYVPMLTGEFYIIEPGETEGKILQKVQLEGNCLGAPAAWDGRVLVHSTEKLYCFGAESGADVTPSWPDRGAPSSVGQPVALQIQPAEIFMKPGGRVGFDVHSLDANGNLAGAVDDASFAKFIPPTARVKAEMDASFEENVLVATEDAEISAGAFKATAGDLSGVTRGRLLANLPIEEDFEGYDLSVAHANEPGVMFAYPPLPWIGARFKWEVRELDGSKVFAKTLDRLLFQRATSFIGPSSASNYTIQADVRTDGNRRIMSDIGLINQRYLASLKGNWQLLEISSNHERIKESVPFKWKAKTWYTLKMRVDVHDDGSGTIRAKAWPRDEAEPAEWTIEVKHANAHRNGAPGLFGFSPQSQKRVYVDNISVTPNN